MLHDLGELKNHGVFTFELSRDGSVLVVSRSHRHRVQDGDQLEVWDVLKGGLLRTIDFDYGRSPPNFRLSADGKTAVVAYGGPSNQLIGGARAFDTGTGNLTQTLVAHKDVVNAVEVSPDGKKAVTSALYDPDIRVWDMESGKTILTIAKPEGALSSYAFAPDGKLLAGTRYSGGAYLWDLATGKPAATLEGEFAGSSGIRFSPDSRRVACHVTVREGGQTLREARVWDAQTGKLVHRFPDVISAPLFLDNNTVALVHKGGEVKAWPLERQ